MNARFVELFAAGAPPLTVLVVGSAGPATPAPADGPVTEPWPACLRGETGEGLSLVLYQGWERYSDLASNGVRAAAGGSLADWSWTLLAGELSWPPRPLDR